MDPLILMGAFLVGGAGGYVVGAQAVAEKLRPGIDRMADRVAELEGELLDAKNDKGVEPIYRTAIEQAFRELGEDAPLAAFEKRAQEIKQTEILERLFGRQMWP